MTDDQQTPPADDVLDVAQLQAELQRYKELAARSQAELQNAKTRQEREASEIRKYASQELLVRLLPTLDNFQRAFQHVPKDLADKEWVKGVAAIEADLMRAAKEAGLTRMQSLGQEADAARHEVLTIGPGEKDKVIEVFEEGYELNGRILRPAKVKVGDGNA